MRPFRPSLLSRFAANIFWMGRYLERAESLARVIDINKTYTRYDRAEADWQPVIDLYADGQRFAEKYKRADVSSVLNFYLLDRDNPASITHAVRAARQNARSVRHLISTEMWTQLNIFYNWVAALTQRDVRLSNLSVVCSDIKLECQTIEGIVDGTLLRDEAWRFYQLGKYIERADQTTRILDIGYARLYGGEDEALISAQWNMLLRSVAGYHAYRSRHPAGSYARDVAAFLLYDREFARAVALCVMRITEALKDIERRQGDRESRALEEARRQLEFAIDTGLDHRITAARLHRFIDDLQLHIGRLTDEIGITYFGIQRQETVGSARQKQSGAG